MRTALSAALALICFSPAIASPSAPPNPGSMFPFVIPWNDAFRGTATDVSFLDAKPAGANGYIAVRDGHFVESKTGHRVRFLGTNFTFASNFPSHEDADKVASHLAKLGVNLVRIHHHDFNWTALWDKSGPARDKFDPAGVDKLDYLIAALKRNGIYVDLNLHVSRFYVPEDGFPASIKDLPGNNTKRIDNIDPHMIELQKKFARDYLCRVNPYTSLTYANDPAVALIEINNEDSLASWPREGMSYFNVLPLEFRREVVHLWNEYLARKYTSTEALSKAWRAGAEDQRRIELASSARAWRLEDGTRDVTLKTTSAGDPTTLPDIEVTNPSKSDMSWKKQLILGQLDLAEGGIYILSLRARSSTPTSLWMYASLDKPDFHGLGFSSNIQTDTNWASYRYVLNMTKTEPRANRIAITVGDFVGTLDLADVRLTRPGAEDAIEPGQNLETRSLDLPLLATGVQRADWRAFLVDTETVYAAEMRDYLRKDLGTHALITDTQSGECGMAGLRREADSDYFDSHAYWQHPHFGKSWDASDWTIANTPMSDSLAKGNGDTLDDLATCRWKGKPYTVTEYNHCSPSDYAEEMWPETASFASAQDWDAVVAFDWGQYGAGATGDKIQNYFAMQGNPAKEGFLPAAALLFRFGGIPVCSAEVTLTMPSSAAYSQTSEAARDEWALTGGKHWPDALTHRLDFALDAATAKPAIGTRGIPSRALRTVDTAAGSEFVADSPMALAGAGYFGGQTVAGVSASLQFSVFGDSFAAFALTPLDGQPIAGSRRILLTICGRAENLDMGWNATRTTVHDKWGHGPVQAEGIPATVEIANPLVRHAWALDPTGARSQPVRVSTDSSKATFNIDPTFHTIWYEIAQ